MRCLHCHIDVAEDVCPQCSVYLPSLLREILPAGTYLHNQAYRLDDVLGRGGFGITYRATHLALQDEVAIKELFPDAYARRESATGHLLIPDEQHATFARELQRFKEEGRCLKDLRAPGVVDVRDMFDEHGTTYLVMEFVSGKTLRAELDASGGQGLPGELVKKIVEQLVAALATVHERQVYHLDIKPENVLLTASEKIVLIDFGAARRIASDTTHRQFDLKYAAPELLNRQEGVGPESDIFELGMLVHELLTGQCPRSAFECLHDQQPQVLSANLTDPWRGLIERALPLQKTQRPASVRTWWETRWDRLPSPTPAPVPRLTFSSFPLDLADGQSRARESPGMAFTRIPVVEPLARQRFADASPPATRTPSPIPVVLRSTPQVPARTPRPAALLIMALILAGLILLVLLILALSH
jgi:serine/threonine protein kinase